MTGSADLGAVAVTDELERLAEAGLDLHGPLTALQWDAHAGGPYAGEGRPHWLRTAIVIGGRGGRFAKAALSRAAPSQAASRPIDEAVERLLAGAARTMVQAGLRAEVILGHRGRPGRTGGSGYCDLVGLAAEAGLGWPSRLGLLLHPEAGPWIHLRGALLVDHPLEPGHPLEAEPPCNGCPAPCADACPGGAVKARFDAACCGETRVFIVGCATRCDARRACVVGTGFRYPPEIEAWHMRHAVAHLPGEPPFSPGGGSARGD